MAAEFVDYKKGPGFWFSLEMLIASDICNDPTLSSKVSDFSVLDRDLFEIFDKGLRYYQFIQERKSSLMEW